MESGTMTHPGQAPQSSSSGTGDEEIYALRDLIGSHIDCETGKVKLTERLRVALKLTPDDWGVWPHDETAIVALRGEGLVETETIRDSYAGTVLACRRKPAGRALLASGKDD
jgi:hypothetical protein